VKITHVEAYEVFIPAADPPFVWRRGLLGSEATQGGLLRIGTDAGAEGLALCTRPGSGPVLKNLVDRVLRRDLVGQDPFNRELLWHRMWELDRTQEIALYLLGLPDVALWDLAGKVYSEPVWRLLGGARTQLPAYASTTTFASVQQFLDVADQCLALGYPAIKLHAFGDAREDADLCRRLREHVGDEIPLMYDGSAGFDLPDAVYLGRVLEEAGYLWYEEPIREFSITSYKWLAERVRVPLLVGETSDGAHMNTADFIASGSASFVRTSADLRGGFTGAMRTAHLADAFRLRAEVHGPNIPNRHLCMAIQNTTYYESLVTSDPVVREAGVTAQGTILAPTQPGVGLPAHLEYPHDLGRDENLIAF
jgi:L-alanine-DL-glutamate epimerase-like enolase superfamily enzyme